MGAWWQEHLQSPKLLQWGVALARQPQPTSCPWNGGRGHRKPGWWLEQLQTQCKGKGEARCWDPHSLQCFRCQGWGHMARECPTSPLPLNQPGRNWGNVAHPLPATAGPANNRPQHSHPNPRLRLTSMRVAWQTGLKEVTPTVPFLNLDPIACLVGWSSEAPIFVDGQNVIVLIDWGAQVSSISSRFCKWKALKV